MLSEAIYPVETLKVSTSTTSAEYLDVLNA